MSSEKAMWFKKGDRVISSALAIRNNIFPERVTGTVVSNSRDEKSVRVELDGQSTGLKYSADFWDMVDDSLIERTRRYFKSLEYPLPEEIAAFVQIELDRAIGGLEKASESLGDAIGEAKFGEKPMNSEKRPEGQPICELCGEPMPEGEEMFKYHGYSGSCPKPPLPASQPSESVPVNMPTCDRCGKDFLSCQCDRIHLERPTAALDREPTCVSFEDEVTQRDGVLTLQDRLFSMLPANRFRRGDKVRVTVENLTFGVRAEAVRASQEVLCESKNLKSGCASTVDTSTNAPDGAGAKTNSVDDLFSSHLNHVQQFLLSMYQTMVDPVEEFKGNIEQLCELLLRRAREDRQALEDKSRARASVAPAALREAAIFAIEQLRRFDGAPHLDEACSRLENALESGAVSATEGEK